VLTRVGMPDDLLAALKAAADDAGTTPDTLAVRILAEELPDALASAAIYAFGARLDTGALPGLSEAGSPQARVVDCCAGGQYGVTTRSRRAAEGEGQASGPTGRHRRELQADEHRATSSPLPKPFQVSRSALVSSQVFSVGEVAEVLGVHPATIRRLIGRGGLPAVRVGGQFRIPRAVVEGLVAGTPPTTPAPVAPAAADVGVSGA